MVLALPVTGFWLIFAASKLPKMPEKTMPALTLFKVSIIIDLVIGCLIAFLLLIVSMVLFVASRTLYDDGGAGIAVGFFLLLVTGGILTFYIIYFKAASSVINGIRYGIINNSFNPFPGIKVFSILTYIGRGFVVFSVLVSSVSYSIASQNMYMLLREIPSEFRGLIESLLPSPSTSGAVFLFELIMSAGVIMCVIALNQFNNRLISKNQ
jgi:hypothetical protein